jgi:hypothetical protein
MVWVIQRLSSFLGHCPVGVVQLWNVWHYYDGRDSTVSRIERKTVVHQMSDTQRPFCKLLRQMRSAAWTIRIHQSIRVQLCTRQLFSRSSRAPAQFRGCGGCLADFWNISIGRQSGSCGGSKDRLFFCSFRCHCSDFGCYALEDHTELFSREET